MGLDRVLENAGRFPFVDDGILLNTGNPITMGFRVGDVIRAAGLPDAANNGRNLRIAGLSSTKITTAETLTANAIADTTCSLTRPGKRLINPGRCSNRILQSKNTRATLINRPSCKTPFGVRSSSRCPRPTIS
jgi:hypothetical protein